MKLKQSNSNLKFIAKFSKIIGLKNAQLSIQEMSFMLVAVFLFFLLVGLFALSIAYSNIKEEASKIAEERTQSSIINLADSPEFGCIDKTNCIDGDKLVALTNRTVYQNFWPFSSLKIVTFSGFGMDEDKLVECTKSSYPDCNIFKIYDKKVRDERAISSFIVLCRKKFENDYTYDSCEIAKIIAGTELKT